MLKRSKYKKLVRKDITSAEVCKALDRGEFIMTKFSLTSQIISIFMRMKDMKVIKGTCEKLQEFSSYKVIQ